MTDSEITEALIGPGCGLYEADSYGGAHQFGNDRPTGPEIPFTLIQRFKTRLVVIKLLVTVNGPHVEAITVMGVEIAHRKTQHHRFDEKREVWTPKTTRVPRAVRSAIDDMFCDGWRRFTIGYTSTLQMMITGRKGTPAGGLRMPGHREPQQVVQ